jgi:hypothetical protein
MVVLIALTLVTIALNVWLGLRDRQHGSASPHAEPAKDGPANDDLTHRVDADAEYQTGHLPSEQYGCHAGSVSSLDDFRQESGLESRDIERSSTTDSFGDDAW